MFTVCAPTLPIMVVAALRVFLHVKCVNILAGLCGLQLSVNCPCQGVTACVSPLPSRYNLFIILYPLGVVGELLTIYAALPFVRRTGMYSMRLPNKYNVSFDYYYCLIIVMLSYIPCKEHFQSRTLHVILKECGADS